MMNEWPKLEGESSRVRTRLINRGHSRAAQSLPMFKRKHLLVGSILKKEVSLSELREGNLFCIKRQVGCTVTVSR